MSAPKHRYELWSNGQLIARYVTLGQALLGAKWRSQKRGSPIYVWTTGEGRFVASVSVVGETVRERYCQIGRGTCTPARGVV